MAFIRHGPRNKYLSTYPTALVALIYLYSSLLGML